MRETAILIRAGLLAAGILSGTSTVVACDGHEKTNQSSCSAAAKTAIEAPCAAPRAIEAPCASQRAIEAPEAPSMAADDNSATGAAAPSTPAPAEAGMRAYIDPETGTLGGPGPLPPPSPEAVKALEPGTLEEPVETVMPDGSVMLDLKGRGQEYFILQLDENGQRQVRCVDDPTTALQTPPTAKRGER
jgi:hypothetical protein